MLDLLTSAIYNDQIKDAFFHRLAVYLLFIQCNLRVQSFNSLKKIYYVLTEISHQRSTK